MIVLDPKQVKKTTEVSVEGPFSVHDTLREGFKSVSHDLAPKHPLQNHLKNAMEHDEERKMILGERSLGLHIPFRMATERSLVQQTGRLAGLPSSNLGLEILTGQDEDFDVSDFLNRTRAILFVPTNAFPVLVPHWSPGKITDSLLN